MNNQLVIKLNKKIIQIAALILVIATMIITQTGCSSEAEVSPVSKDNYYLDTTCTLTVYATGEGLDKAIANEAIDAAYDLCAGLDKTLSKTVEVSDVSKINSAGGKWVEVSDYTAELLRSGQYYSELSKGSFDITIGRLTDLWDFHAVEPKLPETEKLKDAVKHVDYHKLQLNGNSVRLLDPEARIDLGGIAKGYIGDKMVEVMEKKGVTAGIVNLGGNIICIGSKTAEKPFNIGIETPFSDRSEIIGSIEVSDKTLVTSGVYERMFEIDGRIYHHILDTKTGYSAESNLNSVTLIADKGKSMDCDALSTICLMKGYREARKLIESIGDIEAVFVLKNGDIKTTTGAGFNRK